MSIGEDELELEVANEGDEMDITFDDVPPQDKTEVATRAVKATRVLLDTAKAVKAAKAAAPPKLRKTRKPKVAKAAPAPKAKHRVETIDNNKLAAYLDKLVNEEGYTLIDVSGSSSIMGAFTIVSVKVA